MDESELVELVVGKSQFNDAVAPTDEYVRVELVIRKS